MASRAPTKRYHNGTRTKDSDDVVAESSSTHFIAIEILHMHSTEVHAHTVAVQVAYPAPRWGRRLLELFLPVWEVSVVS
jgi:hypothetical protein